MYRDIKLLHTPGTTGSLAIAFWLFGPRTWLVRAYAILWPVLAHIALLRETRHFPLWNRALTSAFFLVVFLSTEGNAVWPTVVMAALSIPIARALSVGRFRTAGLLFGLAILLKQTAAYALFIAVACLLARRRRREASIVLAGGCVPYFLALGLFALLGAAPDMWRWTVIVPFTVTEPLVFRPDLLTAMELLLGFLPLAVEAALEKPGEYETSARWLLVVALGFGLICFPRFQVLQTVASVPCLAVGASRLMRRQWRWLPAATVAAFVLTFVISRGAVLAMGGDFDGKVLFWNDEPAFNALVERLHAMPADTPVYSELWANVHPRAEKLPPGHIYVHHWLSYFFPVDHAGERMARARSQPGTVIVGYRGFRPDAISLRPYAIALQGP